MDTQELDRATRIKIALCKKMREIHAETLASDLPPGEKAIRTERAKSYCEMYGETL